MKVRYELNIMTGPPLPSMASFSTTTFPARASHTVAERSRSDPFATQGRGSRKMTQRYAWERTCRRLSLLRDDFYDGGSTAATTTTSASDTATNADENSGEQQPHRLELERGGEDSNRAEYNNSRNNNISNSGAARDDEHSTELWER